MSDQPKILTEGQVLAVEAALIERRKKLRGRIAIALMVAIGIGLIGYWIYLTQAIFLEVIASERNRRKM